VRKKQITASHSLRAPGGVSGRDLPFPIIRDLRLRWSLVCVLYRWFGLDRKERVNLSEDEFLLRAARVGLDAPRLFLSLMKGEQQLLLRRCHLLLSEKPQCRDGFWGLQLCGPGQGVPTLRSLLPRRPAFFVCVNKLSTYAARLFTSRTILLQQASFQFSSAVLGYPICQATVQQSAQSCFARQLSRFFDKIVSEDYRGSHMFLRHTHVIQGSYKTSLDVK
jgi:hypothetical protein